MNTTKRYKEKLAALREKYLQARHEYRCLRDGLDAVLVPRDDTDEG